MKIGLLRCYCCGVINGHQGLDGWEKGDPKCRSRTCQTLVWRIQRAMLPGFTRAVISQHRPEGQGYIKSVPVEHFPGGAKEKGTKKNHSCSTVADERVHTGFLHCNA